MHRLSYYAQFQRGFSEKYRREEADIIAKRPMLVVHRMRESCVWYGEICVEKKYCQKKFIKNKEKTL